MRHDNDSTKILCVLTIAIGSLLMAFALVLLFKSTTAAVDASHQSSATAQPAVAVAAPQAGCAAATNVPEIECLALLDLYTKTNGATWIDQTNWLVFDSSQAPCDWHGVTCSGDHITELVLARNALSGTLPSSLGTLAKLTRLRLENNALVGRIPPAICNLAATLTDASLDYNGLFTQRTNVERCLQSIDGDWQATQTTAVTDLRPSEFFTDSLRLAWTPISYTTGGGWYEISVATDAGGPYTVHGHTTDKTASGYLVTALEPGRSYYFLVHSVTPPHDDQPSTVLSDPAKMVGVTSTTAGRVLVAAYFPADNDLASEIGYVVERFRFGTALNPNVQVIMLVDGRGDGDTRLLEMADGKVETTTAVAQQWGVTELDTADPAVLVWFLNYARARIPAVRTVVALMGHGVALSPEVEWTAPAMMAAAQGGRTGKIPPLPKEHDFSPSDVTNRGYMSTVDVGQALLATTSNGADPFDVVYFDQCFQGSLDALYEVQKTARVIVASPNYAWLVAAYDKYITQLTPLSTPEEMAQSIIDLYENSLDRSNPNAIFWVRGSDVPIIASAVSVLGDALATAAQSGQESRIATAVRQSQYADTTQCGLQKLQLGPPDELIGLETLAQNLQLAFGVNDPTGVYAAVDTLHTALARVSKRSLTGNPYIAPAEFWDFRDSITVLAPLPRRSPSTVAWRASIYRTDTPFGASWTVDPSQPVTVTASLAYVREGRWDDFLAGWYQDLTPTVGQWCNYSPSAQVIVEDAAPLTLTVTTQGNDSLQLDWTPAEDVSATEYRLSGQGPTDIGWKVLAVSTLDQRSAALSTLPPGAYRFGVLARNAAGDFVAQSNEATIELTSATNLQLFLPYAAR